MKRDVSVWEIIEWIGLTILITWVILKLFRIIESPLTFELAPIITLCLILGGLLADMKNVKLELRRITDSLIKLGQDFKQLKGEHEIIKKKKTLKKMVLMKF